VQFPHPQASSATASFPGAKVAFMNFRTEIKGPLGKWGIQVPAQQNSMGCKNLPLAKSEEQSCCLTLL